MSTDCGDEARRFERQSALAMARIVVVGTSLLADGVAGALHGVDGWDVRIGGVDDAADCCVLPGAAENRD